MLFVRKMLRYILYCYADILRYFKFKNRLKLCGVTTVFSIKCIYEKTIILKLIKA